MGERKGQNKYYPPDFDYKTHKSLSGYHGEHSLRERAKKIDEGILVIRFEMPFNMWCGGCKNHIGMGVRYNAEKSKVGKYYSTPILKFRMRCHLCPNYIEIQTDPAKACYVVVSGGERREQRWDPTENGQIAPEGWENKKRLALDSMYKLEHASTDEVKGKHFQSNLSSLVGPSDWKNEHLVSRVFSKYFKGQKKKRQQDEAFKKKYALDIDLLSDDDDEEDEGGGDEKEKKQKKLTVASPNPSSSKVMKGCSKEMGALLGRLSQKDVPVAGLMGIIRGTAAKKNMPLQLNKCNIVLKKSSSGNNNSINSTHSSPNQTNASHTETTSSHATTTNSENVNTSTVTSDTTTTHTTLTHSTMKHNDNASLSQSHMETNKCVAADENDDDNVEKDVSNDVSVSNVLSSLMENYGSDENEEDDEAA